MLSEAEGRERTTGTCSKNTVYCVFGIFGQSTQEGLLRDRLGNPVHGLLTTFSITAISIS